MEETHAADERPMRRGTDEPQSVKTIRCIPRSNSIMSGHSIQQWRPQRQNW